MLNFFVLIKKNRSARHFFVFVTLFFSGMWCSKTIHPLWFEYNHSLDYFGFSYTAMAIAGSLSFLTGMIVDKFGTAWTLRIGTLLYSIALLLRVFADSFSLSIVSGIVGGLGASTVLVSLRPWIISWSSEKERPVALSINQTSNNLGTSIGVIIAGFGISALGNLKTGYPIFLIVSSVLVLLSVLFVPKIKGTNTSKSKDDTEKKIKYRDLLKEKKLLSVGVIIFGVLSGLVVSMLNPYLPLILKDLGLPLHLISILMTILTILRIVVNPFIGSKVNNKNKIVYFALSEICIAICLLLLLIPFSPYLVMLIVIIRSILISISVLSEELMQISMFSAKLVGIFFGLAQTAFFVGDALGGTIAGWIYNNAGTNIVIVVTASLTVLNSCFYPIFYKLINKNKVREIDEVNTNAVSL